jgi:hypothetical protein
MPFDPNYEGIQELERQRRITELPPSELNVPLPDPEQLASEVFRDFARIGNKAKVLAVAAGEHAKKLWIPVPEAAVTLRGAVKRKDQTSDGSRVSFDLFKDAIEFMEKRREAINLDMFENVTGSLIVDEEIITEQMAGVENPDLDPEELMMFVSPLILLFTLNHLLGPYKAQDSGQVAAGKLPPSTEVGPVIAQTVIGIVMQLLLYGISERALKNMLANSSNIQDVDMVIEQAKRQAPTRMQELAARKVGEGDYELILRHSMDYLARTVKPGYEMWVGYYEARRIRHEAVISWSSGPLYSRDAALQAHGQQPGTITPNDMELNADINRAIAESIVPANTTYLCALKEQTVRLDGALDTMGQVLSSRFGQDSLCCLGLYLSWQTHDWIARSAKLLRIFLGVQGANLQLDFGRLLDNLLNVLQERIRMAIINLKDRITAQISQPVLEGLGTTNDDEWGFLFHCPLIRGLVLTLLRAVDSIADGLIDLVEGFTVSWDGQYGPRFQTRWMVIHTRRQVIAMLEILSYVLDAIDRGTICVDTPARSGNPDFEDFVETLPDMAHVKLSPEDLQRYFSGTEPIEIPDQAPMLVGDTIPSMDDPVIKPTFPEPAEGASGQRCRDRFAAVIDELRRE